MKTLILSRIREYLLQSPALSKFFEGMGGDHLDWFNGMMKELETYATDRQLLTIYTRLFSGNEIVPHGIIDNEGTIGVTLHCRIIGGIDSDGLIHT